MSGGGGGGGGSDSGDQSIEFEGNTSPATITDQNVQDLSIASAEGALHTAKGEGRSTPNFPFGVSANVQDYVLAQAESIAFDLPVGISFDETTDCAISGTRRMTGDFTPQGSNNELFEGDFTFFLDDCQG